MSFKGDSNKKMIIIIEYLAMNSNVRIFTLYILQQLILSWQIQKNIFQFAKHGFII